MNPPFSAAAHVDGRVADAAMRHIASALARVADGGRLVAITGASLSPDSLAWRDAFVRLQERARVVFSAAIDGRVYARHGTTTDTRLTVIDKVTAVDPQTFPPSRGMAPDAAAAALGWIAELPARMPVAVSQRGRRSLPRAARTRVGLRARTAVSQSPSPTAITGVELTYETARLDPPPITAISRSRSAEGYALQSVFAFRARQSASHKARAIGGDGIGRAAEARLSPAPAVDGHRTRPSFRCPARKHHLCG